MFKACPLKTCPVLGDGLRYEYVLQRGAFAADLQGAVVVASLVLVVEIKQQFLHVFVLIKHLF